MDAGTIFDERPRAETLPHILSGINMEYIGETHQALEQELDYQTYLEDELKNCVSRGLCSEQDASNLQTLININREHLDFLSPITSLEHMFSSAENHVAKQELEKLRGKEMVQKVSDRAVDLVNVQCSPSFWDRFYYNCDHFLKSLQKRAEVNYNRYKDIDVEYPSITTTRLNSYITEGLFKFQSLASEVLRILDKAQHVNPVYLRVRGLNRPVSGIMLCDYSTKNFGLRAGQHVYVLDNAYVTPLNTNSETTDASETSECSTCSPYCSLHNRPGCEICGMPLSTTTGTTSATDVEEAELGMAAEEDIHRKRQRNLSDCSTATGTVGGPSDVSITTTPPGCTHTLCSQREPVMWKVRTMDGSLTVDVPAVTVMINEHDEEAISHAYEIYDFFANMWREAIDIWLTKGVKALSSYFSSLIEAKYIQLESERTFEQFLEEVERAFPCEDPESGTANKVLNEMIATLKEKIRLQDTCEETTELMYVKVTEVASYRKTVQKLRDHVNQIKRFMKDIEENSRQDIIDETTMKSVGDLKYVYEESVEQHKKLEKMLRQVNAFRAHQHSPRIPVHKIHSIFGEYYSSSEEITSESETSDSQYNVEKDKSFSPHEFEICSRDETHRTAALTNRSRFIRKPHRKAVIPGVDDLMTESSDEADVVGLRRTGKLHNKPTSERSGEQVLEVVEKAKDTVISSLTLNRKINLEKAMRLRGDVRKISSLDGRYRSRRQLQFTPGSNKGDVSMVYLQITAAKSTQDTMIPTGENQQSRGIQLDIEKIPIDAKDVLKVEPRVASWQSDENGEMRLKHDVSLEPSQQEPRERGPSSERTMEAIVSGTTKCAGHCEHGVQMTSRDEFEGILKPPMFNCFTTSTQTSIRRRGTKSTATITDLQIEPTQRSESPLLHQVPSLENITSTSKTQPHAVETRSGGLSFMQPGSDIRARVRGINSISVIAVSTIPSNDVKDAWTRTDIIEEIVPMVQHEDTIQTHAASPIEATTMRITLRYGSIQTQPPFLKEYIFEEVGKIKEPVQLIKKEGAVTVRSEPSIEINPIPIKLKYGSVMVPIQSHPHTAAVKPTKISTASVTDVLIRPEPFSVDKLTAIKIKDSGSKDTLEKARKKISSTSKDTMHKFTSHDIGITTECLATYVDAWTETAAIGHDLSEVKPTHVKARYGLVQTGLDSKSELITSKQVKEAMPMIEKESAVVVRSAPPV
ncbi:unnamed protein product, partial [Hydatigera taeniaeformis]|uniref:SH2 domain-containing protein n=1 Tax=Hydatigena taeniaeformis TaxID=6205 RepID=A0A0R3X4E8_HYDTA